MYEEMTTKQFINVPQCKPALVLVERFPAANQLLCSDPILLWLIAFFADKNNWNDADYEICFKSKRIDILAQLGFPARKSVLKFLSKLNAEPYDHSLMFNLNYWITSERLHTLEHYPILTLNQIKLFRSCPCLIGTKWSYSFKEITLIKDIQPIIESVNSGIRKAKQIGILPRIEKQLQSLKGSKCLDEMHEYLNLTLKLQGLTKKKFNYPTSVIEGNFNIIPITNSVDLAREAMQQHNCVWTYHEKILAGQYFVYQVMQPERATLGIQVSEDGCLEVDQLLLQDNDDVLESTSYYIKQWFDGDLPKDVIILENYRNSEIEVIDQTVKSYCKINKSQIA